MRQQIPNEDLLIDLIPDPDGDPDAFYQNWGGFALTLNGYETCGGSKGCADACRKVHFEPSQATLTELRCALFFKQRSERFMFEADHTKTAAVIIRLIRERITRVN